MLAGDGEGVEMEETHVKLHNNNNNNNILYSSQQEIKAVIRSHNREHSNSVMKHTHIHTLRQMPPISQPAYTNRKD